MTNSDNKENLKSILAKIRALLSKTIENGATEQEALAAAAKAAELMEKYDVVLDEAEVNDSGIIKDIFDSDPIMDEHLAKIVFSISKLCEVEIIQFVSQSHVVQNYQIFGMPADVEIARYLVDICANAMKHELRKISPEWMLLTKRRRETRQYSFMEGMTKRLCLRINELAWARKQKKTGTAIIIAKDALIKKAMEAEDFKTTNNRSSIRDIHEASLMAGDAAGKKVALSAGVEDRSEAEDRKIGAGN